MATVIEQPQMGLTFEDVWAAILRIEAAIERTQAQHEKTEAAIERTQAQHEKTEAAIERTQAQHEKTEAAIERTQAQLEKTEAEVDRMSKRVDRVTENVGGLNRSMGELIETLIAAKLWEKFDAYSYDLKRAYQRIPIFNEQNKILTDIDILLVNGEYAMAVEVKRELNRKDDVDHHLKRMELILKYPPDQCKGKKLLGAMAGGIVDPDIQEYAQSVGFFVLELSGESVSLIDNPKGFTPRQVLVPSTAH
jgi:predicted RNase H-like nuclease (RuvC/YqgF family)